MSKLIFLAIGLMLGAVIAVCVVKVWDHQPLEPNYLTVPYDVEFKGLVYFDGPAMVCNEGGGCKDLRDLLECPRAVTGGGGGGPGDG